MKKIALATLILALFCLLPPRADASYYRETTLSGGVKIVYATRVALPSQYINAYTYDKCGVLAADGTFLVEPVYQSISAPVEGRAMFYKEGEGYGFFDENWNVVIPAQYRSVKNFSEGLAAVTNERNLVGYIDKTGRTVIPFQYTAGTSFKNGVATVTRADGTVTYITTASLTQTTAKTVYSGTAYARTLQVELNGKPITLSAYAIRDERGNETNYVGLRDFAAALNGTAAQFNVGWNGAVNIETGTAYVPPASTVTKLTGDRAYQVNTAPTLVNGAATALTGILLSDGSGGYNYYMLRDLGQALGITVNWSSARGIYIDT